MIIKYLGPEGQGFLTGVPFLNPKALNPKTPNPKP